MNFPGTGLLIHPSTFREPEGKRMSNMENSSDDVSCLSLQNLGSSSPSKKQSKENTITVSGSRAAGGVAGWDSGPQLGCCRGGVNL